MTDENQPSTTADAGSNAPSQADVSSLPPSSQPQDKQQDIEALIQEVGLPERRDFKAMGDTQSKAPVAPQGIPIESPMQKVEVERPPYDPTSPVVPMRTLKNDLQYVVREKKMSLVRAATLEQDRKEKAKTPPSMSPAAARSIRRGVGILFIGFVLILLGASALLGVYLVMNKGQSALPVDTSTILFAEHSIVYPLDPQSPPSTVKQVLATARTSSAGSLGSITRIVPVVATTTVQGTQDRRPATLAEFLTAIGAQAPDGLVRALGRDFFFGIHVVDKNAPVLIIPVTSYDRAFAGMLAWEKTIDSDLAPIFIKVPPLTTDANGLPVERSFKDMIMRNYDVRVLTDDNGNVALYYSFPNPKILIIAESPYSFPEVLSRLQAGRRL